MTQEDFNKEAIRLTEQATRRTWAYSLRLFGLSKGGVSFLFGVMLMPLQASLSFAKTSIAKPAVVRALRKAPSKHADRPDFVSPSKSGLLVNVKPVEENLLGEFRGALISYAKTLLGRPYRSGGKKPSSGFDCSGFTGYVFKQFGMALPNCSRSQSSVGVKISKDSAKAGDLVFFGRKKRKGHTQIYHAGIVASNDGGRLKVIHSATGEGVVVTDMSRPGYWRNHLVAVRRVIEKPAALALAQ